MDFELLSQITQIEPIARGAGVEIQMTYLRCISNKGFIWQQGKLLDEELVSLTVGKLYKAVVTSTEERERGFVRVVDNSGEDYLYPTNRFEPVLVNGNLHDAAPTATLAAHVPPLLRDILQAEALANGYFRNQSPTRPLPLERPF